MFEKNLNLPRYFQVQKFCLARIGLSLSNEENKLITNYFWAFVPITAKVLLGFSIFYYVGLHFGDIDEVTDAMGPAWQVVLSTMKWFTFMYKRREVQRLVRSIWAWNLKADAAERTILVEENRNDILFSRMYLLMVGTTGYIAVFKPIFIGMAVWLSEGHFPLVPPIKASYPFDMQNPFYFYAQLLWVALAVQSVVCSSVGVDSLFSWITHNVIAQFGILHLRYRRIADEKDGKSSTKSIIECVKYHRRIIDVVDELNDVLGLLIFVKFTISCLQVCVLAYQLTRIKNFADLAFLLTFLLSVALQLILYCRNGQRLKDESENISDYIFAAFEWQNVDVKKRKLLLISMMRARRVCRLSGIFFVVDLTLYLWVFRTAGSYITLLLSLDDNSAVG